MLNLRLFSKETIQVWNEYSKTISSNCFEEYNEIRMIKYSILRTNRIFNYKQNEPFSSSLLPQTILGPSQNTVMSKDNKFILIIVNNFQ